MVLRLRVLGDFMRSRTLAHMSFVALIELTSPSWAVFLQMVAVPIHVAKDPASSVLSARISQFFRRQRAFTYGETYGGSNDFTVIVRVR